MRPGADDAPVVAGLADFIADQLRRANEADSLCIVGADWNATVCPATDRCDIDNDDVRRPSTTQGLATRLFLGSDDGDLAIADEGLDTFRLLHTTPASDGAWTFESSANRSRSRIDAVWINRAAAQDVLAASIEDQDPVTTWHRAAVAVIGSSTASVERRQLLRLIQESRRLSESRNDENRAHDDHQARLWQRVPRKATWREADLDQLEHALATAQRPPDDDDDDAAWTELLNAGIDHTNLAAARAMASSKYGSIIKRMQTVQCDVVGAAESRLSKARSWHADPSQSRRRARSRSPSTAYSKRWDRGTGWRERLRADLRQQPIADGCCWLPGPCATGWRAPPWPRTSIAGSRASGARAVARGRRTMSSRRPRPRCGKANRYTRASDPTRGRRSTSADASKSLTNGRRLTSGCCAP